MTHRNSPTISIRAATNGDGPALARLAALDSAPTPFGPVLLAEVDGRPRAALSLRDDRVVGDPFARTDELVELLRVHARATAQREDSRENRGLARLRLAA
ncbi:MAG TPA: hypothetical protein VGW75_17830 [Solirubrobacteraceae bacterium]|jgi:hypothetical protein|nr:hypothetical protein [Solirubrobacteraceae bacterium]